MKPPHLIPRLAYSTRQELKNAKALEARGGLDPRVPETSRCEPSPHGSTNTLFSGSGRISKLEIISQTVLIYEDCPAWGTNQ